jgi:hypothetical protein
MQRPGYPVILKICITKLQTLVSNSQEQVYRHAKETLRTRCHMGVRSRVSVYFAFDTCLFSEFVDAYDRSLKRDQKMKL